MNIMSRTYSSLFSATVMVLLISFVFSHETSLSAVPGNFRWRNNLIEMYTSFRFKLGDHVYNKSVVGRGGWFFFTGERITVDYQRVEPLGRKKLSNFQKKLDQLNANLEEKGIVLLVVVPPNKSTIYSQYMPKEIPVLGEKSHLDQFVEYMNVYGKTPVVDLRQTLLDASRSQDVYFKTDTHWNDLGAYYGYVEILHALSSSYPDLMPRPLSYFEYQNAGAFTWGISRMMGLPDHMEVKWILEPKFEVNPPINSIRSGTVRTITNRDQELPTLMVFGDSFYDSLAHFIEPHFSHVKTISYTKNKAVWSLDQISQESPDIVLIEFVERSLETGFLKLLEN